MELIVLSIPNPRLQGVCRCGAMPGILAADQPPQTAETGEPEGAECPVAGVTVSLKTAPEASGSLSPITRTPSPAANGKESASDSGELGLELLE